MTDSPRTLTIHCSPAGYWGILIHEGRPARLVARLPRTSDRVRAFAWMTDHEVDGELASTALSESYDIRNSPHLPWTYNL